MALVVQTSLKEIEKIQTYIRTYKGHVMPMRLIMDEFIKKVNYNINAIRSLAFILGRMPANVERNLLKYQQLFEDSDHLLDGLDTLSSGLLSHTIIPPGKLADCEIM